MWRDGNGNATKAWTDPWLVDDDGRFANSPPVDSITMYAWVDIWDMLVCPKARHFLWRLCTRTLPVLNLLKSRHLIEDTACPWYRKDEESWEHALFDCGRVAGLWTDTNCSSIVKDSCLLNACELVASWRIVDAKTKQRGRVVVVFLMWGIWLVRNAKVFEELTTPDSVLLARVDRWVEEHEAGQSKSSRQKRWRWEEWEEDLGVVWLWWKLSKVAARTMELEIVLGDALEASSAFEFVRWLHVGRGGNKVAHHLARVTPFGVEQI
ncbi:Tol-Pal system protein TolB [Bienertia sinuspersici]